MGIVERLRSVQSQMMFIFRMTLVSLFDFKITSSRLSFELDLVALDFYFSFTTLFYIRVSSVMKKVLKK